MDDIRIKTIGYVSNDVKEPRFGSFSDEISEVIVDKEFTDALNGLEDYSHVIIVFWMDKVIARYISGKKSENFFYYYILFFM